MSKAPKSGAGAPPSLSLWRAAQVLAGDPKLSAKFEEVARGDAKTLGAQEPGVRSGAKSSASSDTFEAEYARQRDRSRYRLSDAVPILDALATVAGENGVIEGDEWKRLGPKFSPLALRITELAKSSKPATGEQLVPVMLGISETTRKRLGATSENRIGVDQMPVLAGLLADVEASKPLSGMRVFAVQHLFASTFGLFEALERAGANAKESLVFGKWYSTNPEVQSALGERGWTVHEDFAAFVAENDSSGRLVGVDSPLLSELGRALKSAASANPPEKLLLLDEGGKLNRMLHDVYPEYAEQCVIVEQTTNGLQNMEGVSLRAPAVSVASSELKREVEGPVIGEDVAKSTLETLDQIDPRIAAGKTVGIVGYGAVGSATAEAFAARGFKVIVTDIDPSAEQKAAKAGRALVQSEGSGSIEVRPRSEVLGAGIIVGCTGRGCMSTDETKLIKDGAVLVSAASGDHEFPVVRTLAASYQGARRAAIPMRDWGSLVEGSRADAAKKRRPVADERPRGSFGSPQTDDGTVTGLRGQGDKTFAFPTGQGEITLDSMEGLKRGLTDFYLKQGSRRFVVLRGGTPINMDRDLPPNEIQLTRSMLFAGCLQAAKEASPGWKVFDEGVQARIESHWREAQQRNRS
ncbi:MAG: hypothetical protein HYV07_30285 [Deltaproteobacteria bacterium]|nr:hypothetical protein [Deltaproteobacteria bacterium]